MEHTWRRTAGPYFEFEPPDEAAQPVGGLPVAPVGKSVGRAVVVLVQLAGVKLAAPVDAALVEVPVELVEPHPRADIPLLRSSTGVRGVKLG